MAKKYSEWPDKDIKPIQYSAIQLITRDKHIKTFALDLIENNPNVPIDQADITWHWKVHVRHTLPESSSEHDGLLAQTNCPLFHAFWQEHHDPDAFQLRKTENKNTESGFRIADRAMTKFEKITWKDAAIIMEDDNKELLIPGIMLTSLEHLQVDAVAKSVLKANKYRKISFLTFQALFNAVLDQVYFYEPKSAKVVKEIESASFTNEEYNGMVMECDQHAKKKAGSKRLLTDSSGSEYSGDSEDSDDSDDSRYSSDEELLVVKPSDRRKMRKAVCIDDMAASRTKIAGPKNSPVPKRTRRRFTGRGSVYRQPEIQYDIEAMERNDWRNAYSWVGIPFEG